MTVPLRKHSNITPSYEVEKRIKNSKLLFKNTIIKSILPEKKRFQALLPANLYKTES